MWAFIDSFYNDMKKFMKRILSIFSSLVLSAGFLNAQAPVGFAVQPATTLQGTDLGANTTTNAAGIALGNRFKLRGFVDFQYSHLDNDLEVGDDRLSTDADVDFLIDFSPVTAEVHLKGTTGTGKSFGIEQAFGRYSFNRDFNISFGRQVTNLGYEGDEPTDLYTVSNAYFFDVLTKHSFTSSIIQTIDNTFGTSVSATHFRKNYVDGIRANFNNGQFGISLGLHDKYWVKDDFNDNVAIDLAASIMILPGLEARMGYAYEEEPIAGSEEIEQFNAWVSYNPGALTLGLEYDNFDLMGVDLWDVMFLANYQFTHWFGATLRYAHEDVKASSLEMDSDRFSLALLFALTDNFNLNLEYSHTELGSNTVDIHGDMDELYLQGLLYF